MKTIVINTSKEAIKTKLDILFNAPFDRNSLLRYECKLGEICTIAEKIKQDLINDTDIIDRDYNLIVLVDLYEFPYGDKNDFSKLYKMLLTHYIKVILAEKLHKEFNLPPMGVSIYFADSSKQSKNLDIEKLSANPVEQKKKEQEEYLHKFEKISDSKEISDDEDLEDDSPYKPIILNKNRSVDEKRLMELFSWTDNTPAPDLEWKIKASIHENDYIDFYNVFEDIAISNSKSDSSAQNVDFTVNHIISVLSILHGNWDTAAFVELSTDKSIVLKSLTYHFERNNEQTLIEGFFGIYANVFTCVQEKSLFDSAKLYTGEETTKLLIDALKKYKYFSDEQNIPVDFEPISQVFDSREAIFKEHQKKALENSKYKDSLPAEVAEKIMEASNSKKTSTYFNTTKMTGTDRAFFDLAESIFNNYDSEVIEHQNNEIVQNCLVNLWDWKNKNRNDDFKKTVQRTINKNNEKKQATDNTSDDSALSRNAIEFIKSEHEKEYVRLVNDITNVEHRLSSNKNILRETNDLIVKFNDLRRKGKRYLISFIGAIIAVLAAVFPYIYIQIYTTIKPGVSLVMFLLFTAGFAFLYALASGTYLSIISHEKRKLMFNLEELKEESEKDRKESIIALYNFYSNTIVEANSHYLLWNEILRMDAQNARKGIKRNAHINRFSKLVSEVERYLTMLKIDISDIDCSAENDCTHLTLDCEEPFYSENNKKVYGILPETKNNNSEKTEEGED